MFLKRFSLSAMLSFLQQMRRIRGELLWILTGHAAAFLGGLLGIKLLTNLLGPSGYGRLALGLTIAGFLTTFLHNPLSNSAARFYAPYRDGGKGTVYFTAIRGLHKKILLILLPAVVLIPAVVMYFVNINWGLLVLAGLLFGLTNGIWASFLAWQNASRDRRAATLGQIADVWLRISIAIVLAMLVGSGEGALFGYVIGTSLVLLWQNRLASNCEKKFIRDGEALPNPEAVKSAQQEFKKFSVPFVGYAVFASLTLYADRWIVQGLNGAESVGVYSAMLQLASSPVNIMFAVINQLMVPIIYEKAGAECLQCDVKQETKRLLKTITLSGATALVCIVVPIYFFSQTFALIFTTPEFAAQSKLIPLMVLGMGVFHLGQICTLEGNCINRPGIYLWAKVIHALLLCFAGVVLTYCLGAYGMALANTIASFVYIISVMLINRRLIK